MNERDSDSGVESSNSGVETLLYIRISVPELGIQKCLQFNLEDSIWTVKLQILSKLVKDIKDGLNYGLYCPPTNGKAGKFLDEERLLKDYPLASPIGFLEFKLKRRVYKRLEMNSKKLKQINTKGNLKQLMELIRKGDVEKMMKLLSSGLDPNFIDEDLGETPLTHCMSVQHPSKMITTLVSEGAHIDLRNKHGLTPVHIAVEKDNDEALKTLLNLGASPNYKDSQGLTPLFHAVSSNTGSKCVEMLLYDHAFIGVLDSERSSELHKACKGGKVQQVELLIYYGADLNWQNSNGDTPLHICAVHNWEECARVLLFRGIDKSIQNNANQVAFDLALVSGNIELAQIIKNFSHHEVVQYQEIPKYNDKRRSTISFATISNLHRSHSNLTRSLLVRGDSQNGIVNYARYGRNFAIYEQPNEYSVIPSDNSDSLRSVSISSNGSGGDIDSTLASAPSFEHNAPRAVVLQQEGDGFGFILRGAKVVSDEAGAQLNFKATRDIPALQFFDCVDANGIADRAGVKTGDFLLAINGQDVRMASHELAVKLIQAAGDRVVLVIISPNRPLSALPTYSNESDSGESIYAEILPRSKIDEHLKNSSKYESDVNVTHTTPTTSSDEFNFQCDVDQNSWIPSSESIYSEHISTSKSSSSENEHLTAILKLSSDKTIQPAFINSQVIGLHDDVEPASVCRVKSKQYLVNPSNSFSVNQDKYSKVSSETISSPPMPPPILSTRRNNKVHRQASEPSKSVKYSLPPLPPDKDSLSSGISPQSPVLQSEDGIEIYVGNRNLSVADKSMKHNESDSSDDRQFLSRNSKKANGIYSRVDHSRRIWSDGKIKIRSPSSNCRSQSQKPLLPLRNYIKKNAENPMTSNQITNNKYLSRRASNLEGLAKISAENRLTVLGKRENITNALDRDNKEERCGFAGSKLQIDLAQLLARRADEIQRASRDDELRISREVVPSLSSQSTYGMTEDQSITDYATESKSSDNKNNGSLEMKIPSEIISKKINLLSDISKAEVNISSSRNDSNTSDVLPPPPPPPLLTTSVQNIYNLSEHRDQISMQRPDDNSLSPADNGEGHTYSSDAALKPLNHQKHASPNFNEMSEINEQLSVVLPAPPEFNEENHSGTYRTPTKKIGRIPSLGAVENHLSLSRPVTSWSVDDVVDWLVHIAGVGEHARSFIDHEVDGRTLARLGRTELISLGVTHVGQRMNIERAVKRMILTQNN